MSLADELKEILLQEERWELIYRKINGEYIPIIPEEEGIRDEISGGVLGPLVQQIYQAGGRIAQRLGVDPALDPDFNLMTDGLEGYARACGELMYHYGYQDGVKAK